MWLGYCHKIIHLFKSASAPGTSILFIITYCSWYAHIIIIIFYNYNEKWWNTQEDNNTESQLLQIKQIQEDGATCTVKRVFTLACNSNTFVVKPGTITWLTTDYVVVETFRHFTYTMRLQENIHDEVLWTEDLLLGKAENFPFIKHWTTCSLIFLWSKLIWHTLSLLAKWNVLC